MKVVELFAGIGAWGKALTNLGIEHEIVAYAEKDKYPSKAYSAIHGIQEDKNVWDITKCSGKGLGEVDLVCYSPPCQTFSRSGKQEGTKDSRGLLFYDALRIIKSTNPKYAVMENVEDLALGNFKFEFRKMKAELTKAGYRNYARVINSRDYGMPQNRKRVFIVSVRNDIDTIFTWPKSFDNGLRLKDFLQKKVNEKYYLSQKIIKGFIQHRKRHEQKGNGFKFSPIKDTNTIAKCIATVPGGRATDNYIDETEVRVREATKKGYAIAKMGDSINFSLPNSKTRRGRVGKGFAQTLDTQCNQATLTKDYKIRKLTPLECFRLQGFDDEDYWKARRALEKSFYNGKDRSDSRMYKMAGNSITVNVPMEIFKNLLLGRVQDTPEQYMERNQLSMF
ncbi:MAG: DNA cytosine methyltransferase [Firmicutes bacterium]|nr:DNA cytosine methyltransferase [Bacillota bacterium]